jgi:hypothetical protein
MGDSGEMGPLSASETDLPPDGRATGALAPVDAVGRVQAGFVRSDGGAQSNQRARGGRVALPIALHTSTGGIGDVGGMGTLPRSAGAKSQALSTNYRSPAFRSW